MGRHYWRARLYAASLEIGTIFASALPIAFCRCDIELGLKIEPESCRRTKGP
jgi:hypothetical protein